MSSSPHELAGSSSDSEVEQEVTRHNRRHDSSHPSRRSEIIRDSTSQRPLPELPLPRSPASRSGSTTGSTSSHSGQMLAAILRDRPLPLPLPVAEQTAEERRRSIIALDRKRRLTNPALYEESKRKTSTSGLNDRRASDDAYRVDGPSIPRRHASSDATTNRPLPEIIDLTGSPSPVADHPHVRPTPRRRTSSDNSRRYVVPSWQPDSEVNECPICNRPFTWMFRRHHCRKCGRVVCNDCSPHRITIPRQFIVHPPGPDTLPSPTFSSMSRRADSIDSSGDDELDLGASSPRRQSAIIQLEGGEKVRLCNPCVPDPQPDPLPNYPPLIPTNTSRGTSWNFDSQQNSSINRQATSETRPRGFSAGAGFQSHSQAAGNTPVAHQYHRSMGAIVPPSYGNSGPRAEGFTLFGSYRGQSSPSRYRGHEPTHSLTPAQPFGGPLPRVSVCYSAKEVATNQCIVGLRLSGSKSSIYPSATVLS